MDDPAWCFLVRLLAAGVGHSELIRIDAVVSVWPAMVTLELARCIPRLLLVQPNICIRDLLDAETSAFAALLLSSRARRSAHKQTLARTLAMLPSFCKLPWLLLRVLQFLEAPGTPQRTGTYICMAHGCRTKVADILQFLYQAQNAHFVCVCVDTHR